MRLNDDCTDRLMVFGLVWLGALVVICVLGCVNPNDECKPEPPRCENNVAIECEPDIPELGAPNKLKEVDCSESDQVCVIVGEEPRADAICAASAEPSPDCPSEGGNACVADELVSCTEGYEVSRRDCDVCIEGSSRVFCARSDEPDPRCPEGSHRQFVCEGDDQLLSCMEGYLTDTTDCDAGKTCVESRSGEGETRVFSDYCD